MIEEITHLGIRRIRSPGTSCEALDDMPNDEKGRRKADDKGDKCDNGVGWQSHL